MDFIEVEGKTEEEAIERALKRTGAREEDVKTERIEDRAGEGYVKIRMFYNKKKTDTERAKKVLENILEKMDIRASVDVSERDEELYMNIESESRGLLIGQKGETLNALQSIVNRIVNKDILDRVRIVVDTENYRGRHQGELEALAETEAAKVKETGKEISLPPMNSEERRIIHIALKDDEEIQTESIGEDPDRRVVISPKEQT